MNILFLFIGLIIGFMLAYFIVKSQFKKIEGIPIKQFNELDKDESILQERLDSFQKQKVY